MVYKVPCERSFEYKLIKSYTLPMCTAGMNNFRINKPMHISSSIIETNWVSQDVYHSCSMILVWLSQTENHNDYWQNLQTTRITDWRQQNCLQKENDRSLGEPLLDLFPSYSLWFLFWGLLVFSLVWSVWDWRRGKPKEGSSQIWGKIFGSTCRSEHIWVGCYCHLKLCHSSNLFCGHWPTLGKVKVNLWLRLQLFWRKKSQKQSLKAQPGANKI